MSHAEFLKDAHTQTHNGPRDVVEGISPDTSQKGANGKPIEVAHVSSDTLTEENNKSGEVHGGCKESENARPIARQGNHVASSANRGVRWDC